MGKIRHGSTKSTYASERQYSDRRRRSKRLFVAMFDRAVESTAKDGFVEGVSKPNVPDDITDMLAGTEPRAYTRLRL